MNWSRAPPARFNNNRKQTRVTQQRLVTCEMETGAGSRKRASRTEDLRAWAGREAADGQPHGDRQPVGQRRIAPKSPGKWVVSGAPVVSIELAAGLSCRSERELFLLFVKIRVNYVCGSIVDVLFYSLRRQLECLHAVTVFVIFCQEAHNYQTS